MKYKLSDIATTIPTGGKIVAMIEYQGYVMLATEQHVFRGKFDTDEFVQICFRPLEEGP